MGVDGSLGRIHHPGVSAQPEVVVGTKVQHFAAVFKLNHCALRGGDDALALVQACLVDGRKLLRQLVFDASKHGRKVQPRRAFSPL